MNQARALAIVGALLCGVSFTAGGVAGRMTAPVPVAPPAEIHFVPAPPWLAPAVEAPPAAEPEPVAPAGSPPEASKVVPAAPPAADVKPAPPAKAEAKPKAAAPKRAAPARPRPRAASSPKRSMPSCEAIKREYDRMTLTERMAAYRRATAEEIAHGRRCLGL